MREHLTEELERLAPVAADLQCSAQFGGVADILHGGASYERQVAVADATGGDLHEVVEHLIREFRSGPETL